MNPLEYVKPVSARLVSPRKAVFVVDIAANSHLRDPNVVHRAMTMYMEKYVGLQGWTADAEGGMLTITVEGDLSIPNSPFKE